MNLEIIGNNVTNIRIFQDIQDSLKLEPVLTTDLCLIDLHIAFNRIEMNNRLTTTVMCHPLFVNNLRHCRLSDTYILEETKFPISLTEEEIINNQIYGIIGNVWLANVRVCNYVKKNMLWLCSTVPEDDYINTLSDEDILKIEKIIENLYKKTHKCSDHLKSLYEEIKKNFMPDLVGEDVFISCPIILRKK
jgi:hypothetical protein